MKPVYHRPSGWSRFPRERVYRGKALGFRLTWEPRVWVQLEPVPLGTGVPWTGLPHKDLPSLGKKFPQPVSHVRLEPVPIGTGVPRTFRVLGPPWTGHILTNLMFGLRLLRELLGTMRSALQIHLLWELRFPWALVQLRSRFTTEPVFRRQTWRPPRGDGSCRWLCGLARSHRDTGTERTNTTGDASALNWTDRATVAAHGSHLTGTASSGTQLLVAMAMAPTQVAGPVGCWTQQVSGLGSQAAQTSDSFMLVPMQKAVPGVSQNFYTGEVSSQASKYLPVSTRVADTSGIKAVPSVSTPNMTTWQNPSSIVAPSTAGMDLLWGSSALSARQAMWSGNLPQQWQDNV